MRDTLETYQTWFYAAAILLGLLTGWQIPASTALVDLLTPALAVMMFATFLQLPLGELRQALAQPRFLASLLCANFLLVPLLVLALLPLLPADPLMRFGMLLVLLAPCIDYVVVFAHQGRADARLLLAATPILLLAQAVALPLLLGLFLSADAREWLTPGPLVDAFVWVVLAPLLLAGLAQGLRARHQLVARLLGACDLWPVPATALVLFLVVAGVMPQLSQAPQTVAAVLPGYLAFALLAPLAGWLCARLFRLPPPAARAVAFSTATRNSLIVLPIGLAVPQAAALLAVVIVTQTLVELASEILYVRWLPRLIRDRH